jgi:hypothetical protein
MRASYDFGTACTLRLAEDDAPDGIAFVLLDTDTGAFLGCPDTGCALPLLVRPAAGEARRIAAVGTGKTLCLLTKIYKYCEDKQFLTKELFNNILLILKYLKYYNNNIEQITNSSATTELNNQLPFLTSPIVMDQATL